MYPQLRVALAREVSLTGADVTETDGTMLGALRGAVDRFASRLGNTVSALTEEGLDAFVRDIDDAQRLLLVGNGEVAARKSEGLQRSQRSGEPLGSNCQGHVGAGKLMFGEPEIVQHRRARVHHRPAHDAGEKKFIRVRH